MSRFLLTTLGSLGDLYPYIAVARSLIGRGQQAVLATAEEYRTAVEEAGVEFAPVRPGFAELGEYQELVKKAFDVRRGPEFLIRELIMPHLYSAYSDLWQASAGADLLVSHPLTYALPVVAEKRGLPWVATVLSPMSFVSSYDPPTIPSFVWFDSLRSFRPWLHRPLFALGKFLLRRWEAPVQELRRQLGLRPSARSAMFEGQFSPLANLALFDRELAAPQPDWPERVEICGAPVYDGPPAARDILEELEHFLDQGDPPLVFVLGSSAVWLAGDFWRSAIDAALRLGKRAILITGSQEIGSLPEAVKTFSFLPYSRIFPKAAAVVHQAGIGTLAQAMRAGRPQLIVPVAFDQPDNARRAAGLGVARILPFRKVKTEQLASELYKLLTNPRYQDNARILAGQLAARHGADRAADALIAAARADFRAGMHR
jgi:UDP:flavonoid glycosyltransferase YjiC (YdhE family)